jgi:hypothetical protein
VCRVAQFVCLVGVLVVCVLNRGKAFALSVILPTEPYTPRITVLVVKSDISHEMNETVHIRFREKSELLGGIGGQLATERKVRSRFQIVECFRGVQIL